jgi:cell division protease FtsH
MFLPVPGQGQREYSEETARLVDEEIKKVLSDAHTKVRTCLSAHRQALDELAKLLLEKEVVERPQLQGILKDANGSCADPDQSYAVHQQPQVADDHKV